MKTKRTYSRTFKTAAAVLLLGVTLAIPVSMSYAGLLIMPIRTVFLDGDRSKGITLANYSAEPNSFRIKFLHQKQVSNGGYAIQKEPLDPKYDLSKMLVFSPRQVDLEPQSKQSIRMSVRRPADLPDGEYRTHLAVQQMPSPAKIKEREEKKKAQQTLVHVNVGFAVPVILRKGAYDTTATMSDIKFTPLSVKKGKEVPPTVDLFIDRKGKYSALGRIDVFWTPPGGNTETKVGVKENVSIFPELDRRSVFVHLKDKSVNGGKLRLVFKGEDADKDRSFDEKTITIGG
jgi:P pilus assembly chaperone PapD